MENYFAYGFNLDHKNLCKRIGRKIKSKFAILPGYKLLFNVRSKFNDKSFANITPSKNDIVFGVVYRLTEKELLSLDNYEDVHLGVYDRMKVYVMSDDIDPIKCWIYICQDKYWITDDLEPTSEYLYTIIESISEHLFL
jgi:gamma-glutamylcyclotransferase (GGCT)/AIG2-like uncharacterized protein YtfP